MWKKILTMSLVLVMVLSFTACAKEPSAQKIIDGVIESFDNIRTYQWELVVTQYQTGEVEGEVLEHTVTVDNSGTLDLEKLQMSAEVSMVVNMLVPEEDEVEERVEMYIIDGMMYARPEEPGIEEPMWTKEELPAQAWEMLKGLSGLENYKELLKTAKVKVIGSEKVKGVDCYVLQLTPEMAELLQTTGGGFAGGVPGAPPIPEEILQEVFSDFTVKQWIAKDTYFLMKAEIDTVMQLTSEFWEYLGEEGEMSIDSTLSFLVYNYNKPVTIVVPPEALEATEIPPEDEEVEYEAIVKISCDEFLQSNHHSGEFEVEVGERILVELCSNPTTGFQWDYEMTIENILREEDYDFEEPEDEDIVGAAGKEVWTFEAVEKGTTEVRMEYSRPWEGGEKAEWTYTLTVTVE